MPIHGQGSEFATFTLVVEGTPLSAQAHIRAYRHDVHLIAFHFHEAVGRFLQKEFSVEPTKLAPRERECLLWTARGKTSWEISQILKLSEGTIVSYLNTAKSKLGVFSKHHAVVRAIMLGLIVP